MENKFAIGEPVILNGQQVSTPPMVIDCIDEKGVHCVYYCSKSGDFKKFVFNPLILKSIKKVSK